MVILRLSLAVFTKAVVAIYVVFVPAVAVGAFGVPVKVGELVGALPLARSYAAFTADGVAAMPSPVDEEELVASDNFT